MTLTNYKPHPLLARLLPPSTPEEIERAVDRVRRFGQREEIEVVGNEIVTGYDEYLGCRGATIEPRVTPAACGNDLVEYIVRRTVPRHLSTLDRACIAVLAQHECKALGRERMREGGRIGGTSKGRDPDARPLLEGERWFEAAAKMVGTRPGAVRVLARLLKNHPDVFRMVRARRIATLREAKELARRVAQPADRARLVARYERDRKENPILRLVEHHERENMRASRVWSAPKGRRYVVHTGSMQAKAVSIADRSVDLVHADVVYGDIPMVEEVATISARVLVDGGVLALIAGNALVPETVNALARHLTVVTIGTMLFRGSSCSLPGNAVLRVDAMPVYLCVKGKSPKRSIEHLAFDSGGLEKAHHPWQKSASATLSLVEALVDRGSVVLDPCCGSGTTGVAALRHGCHFIGIELEPAAARIAAARLAEAEKETVSSDEPRRVAGTTRVRAAYAAPKAAPARATRRTAALSA